MSLLDQIIECEHRVWRSVVSKDGTALAEVFADDYVEVTADGKRVSKDSVVEESPIVDEIESYVIANPRIIELGSNAVVLSYHLTLVGKLSGETISPRTRWATSVWRRAEGQWQCCLFQQTGAPNDQS